MNKDNEAINTEAWLIDACTALGLRVENAESDFFEAGGTSITAVKLLVRVEEHFGDDALTPEILFAQSRVADLARHISQHRTTREA
ncbi:Phosphopantetheine attachment site [Paraburkholderia steynii]|uniref:Phosphopantetheine attachment site n=1 Tax=Paraburkholderia steynii TaxID=1245441 RepID=A0A7Z7FQS1_9BURK|nr:phosphopantetheine-binding protein [Paraburkholderia steynii]SDJ53648.1 Phosphopantetheine attachment site [Paraburkholderia steynii]